jgi:hypothetical protein
MDKPEIESYINLLNKYNELSNENNVLKYKNNKIQNKFNKLNEKIQEYHVQQKKVNILKNRFKLTLSILNTIGKSACAYGSFIRKCFETLLLPNEMKYDNLIGDVKYSDINIIFNNVNTLDKLNITYKFFHFFYNLEISKLSKTKNNNKNSNFLFFNYSLQKIQNHIAFIPFSRENIPQIKLYFSNYNDNVCVNIFAWKCKEFYDFSANAIQLTHEGFLSSFQNISIYDILEDISFKRIRFIHNLNVLQNHAFPENSYPIPISEKYIFLNKIYELISTRFLNISQSNYKLYNNFLKTEYVEDCSITGGKPPYPLLKLQCQHFISIMAYKGIISKTDDNDSQCLRCPFCRKDLKIDFSELNNSVYQTLKVDIDNTIELSNTTIESNRLININTMINRENIELL